MPYIKQVDRLNIQQGFVAPQTPGELNFAVTLLIQRYLVRKGVNYQTINDILGALDGASKEFYRRVAAPYEDNKIAENGDVY